MQLGQLKAKLAAKKVGESIVLEDWEIRTIVNWLNVKPITDEEFNRLAFDHMQYRGVKIIRAKPTLRTATPP